MSVENVGGATAITGEHIQVARLLALKGRLKLEIVGLKSRGRSTSTILKQEFGWKGNKQKLLTQLEGHIAGLK
jgi:hypothetical protein